MAILTISRQIGAGGKEIGEGVAAELGYELVGKHRVLKDLRDISEQWERWGEALDEHSPSIWEKYDWSFKAYGAIIQGLLLEHASADNVVLMERGGNILLKGIPHAYRIRVVAPLEQRIRTIELNELVDLDTAQWLAKKSDHERSGFIYSLFGIHWDDPAEYDHVYDTSKQPIEEVVPMVMKILRAKDEFATLEARTLLEMRAMAARIKAGLLMDPKRFAPTLDVEYNGKELVLRGIVHSHEEHTRLEKAARKLAGNKPLRCDLSLRG